MNKNSDELLQIYNQATNMTSMGIHVVDIHTRELYFSNEAGFRLLDKEPCEFEGRSCYEVFLGRSTPCDNCRLKEALQGERTHMTYMPEEERYFRTNTEIGTWNGKEVLIEYLTDVTVEKKAEIENKKNEIMLENASASSVAVMEHVAELKDREMLSRISKNEYDYVGLIDLVCDKYILRESKDIAQDVKDIIRENKNFDYDIAVQKLVTAFLVEEEKEGILKALKIQHILSELNDHSKYVLNYTVQIAGKQKRKELTFCFLNAKKNEILFFSRDISQVYFREQKQLESMEKALRQARIANEAKTTFLSRMSHEIRTPINAIIGIAELEKQDVENGKITNRQIMSYAEDTKHASNYLLSLVNDILDTAKIDSGKMELHPVVVNVDHFVSTIMTLSQPLADARNVKFAVERKRLFPSNFFGDGVRVQQILMNLLSNAFKFTPPDGEVRLEADVIEVKEKTMVLQFRVIDNGIGMSSDFQKKLFQEFVQEGDSTISRTSGSGLGLSLARKLARMMEGDIQCESEKGKGSIFTVIIETGTVADDVKSAGEEEIISHKDVDLNGIRILLCEDHPLNQKIAQSLLERKNCIVEIAEDGVIGVDKFVKSEIRYYSLVLMDIRMPNMDGLEATRSIRELNRTDAKTIPILAMSANAYQEDIQMSLNAGMNDHLAKPVDPAALYHAVAKFTNADQIPAPVQKDKILLVDDVAVNRSMAEKVIRMDYDVIMAENGIEALQILENESDIIAVVTDLQMPQMDGIELIREIRKEVKYDNIAILANTQYGDREQEKEVLEIGADDFVYKPIERTLISTRLKNVLARRRLMI